MKADFVMMTGLPASGKSTFIDWCFRSRGAWYPVDLSEAVSACKTADCSLQKESVILSSDHLIEVWGEGQGLLYPEAFPVFATDANTMFKRNLTTAIHEGYDIILDRTFLTKGSRRKALTQLLQNKRMRLTYRTTLVVASYDLELALLRNSKRTLPNGSLKLPSTIIENMAAGAEYPDASEGFDRIVTIDDVDAGRVRFDRFGNAGMWV